MTRPPPRTERRRDQPPTTPPAETISLSQRQAEPLPLEFARTPLEEHHLDERRKHRPAHDEQHTHHFRDLRTFAFRFNAPARRLHLA